MVAFATVESVLVINIEQGRYPFPNPCAFLAKVSNTTTEIYLKFAKEMFLICLHGAVV